MEKKEKQENAGAQKPVEKNMKLYLVCSFVAGLLLAFIITNLIVGCGDQREANNTVRYTNIDKAINDAMREKEKVDGMKVDETWKHGLDSIGIFEKDGKRGFYNLNTDKVLVAASYTHAWFFSEGLAAVQRNGMIGFIDRFGNVTIDFKFPYHGNPLSEFIFKNGHS